MENIYIKELIPIDLNCILHKYEQNLASFAELLELPEKRNYYSAEANARKKAINNILYDHEHRTWFDYNHVHDKLVPLHSAASFFPLWSNTAEDYHIKEVVSSLPKNG